VAQALSIVPGLGQVYYGAYKRAAQYFAGVVVPAAAAFFIYQWSMSDFANLQFNGLLKSFAFLAFELLVLAFVVAFISFWIAAWWDAKQGTLALVQGRPYAPRWWYVKMKEFLFDEPETEPGESDE
jgi:hypothetical protein